MRQHDAYDCYGYQLVHPVCRHKSVPLVALLNAMTANQHSVLKGSFEHVYGLLQAPCNLMGLI